MRGRRARVRLDRLGARRLDLVLTGFVLFALRPAVSEAARHGVALAAGRSTDAVVSGLPFPPVVSLVALVTATIVSIYKPWGRIRKRKEISGRVSSGARVVRSHG